jgi:ubiquinone/menaquinone biosynthesis C-methylase UbiE
MPQNIYDDDAFFAEYGKLRRSLEGLEGAQEWPAMRALLPDLTGKRVLDLGCGYGWFCRFARENGAAQVMGVDVSEKMLARARETTADPAIEYVRSDIEMLELPTGSFDLVYSSLALHYVEDFSALVEVVYRWVATGGNFVFSVEHPVFTASGNARWSVDEAGEKSWLVARYFDEGPRATDWLAKGVIKQHRTLTTTLNALIRAGFTLTHVEEWAPSDEQISSWPDLAENRIRPSFLLVAAQR